MLSWSVGISCVVALIALCIIGTVEAKEKYDMYLMFERNQQINETEYCFIEELKKNTFVLGNSYYFFNFSKLQNKGI